MQLDERFPLESLPSRARNAVLDEFNGRCPSIFEVANRPKDQWLRAPGIGPRVLEQIRSVILSQQRQTHLPTSPRMADAELLARLNFIQGELRSIRGELEKRLAVNP